MPRPKTIIDADLAELAKEALVGIKDYHLVLKLQVIISSEKHPMTTVADMFGIGRQSVRNWILAFRRYGLNGLIEKAKGHRPSKLSTSQWAEVSAWIENAQTPQGKPCHWTLEELRQTIEKQFGIRLGLTALWRQVHIMGFRPKVPRPTHVKADPLLQADFKINC